jgi:hypothetical protein
MSFRFGTSDSAAAIFGLIHFRPDSHLQRYGHERGHVSFRYTAADIGARD